MTRITKFKIILELAVKWTQGFKIVLESSNLKDSELKQFWKNLELSF